MPTYPSGVITLHEKYGVPAILGTIDLDKRIEAGAELDPANLDHAKVTATTLRGILKIGNHAELTEEVVQGAELRARAVENIHSAIEFTPANLLEVIRDLTQSVNDLRTDVQADMQVLRNEVQAVAADMHVLRNDMQVLRDEVNQGRAETHNALTRMRNRTHTPGDPAFIVKTVPGSGILLARGLMTPNLDAATRQALETYAANNPNPAIGSLPAFFNSHTDDMHHLIILKLIVFYNESMGISAGDGLTARKVAVRNFLTGF